MNRENLQRMADYIRTIPQDRFNMRIYRDVGDYSSHECDSLGCVIGHCTVLDDVENIPIRMHDMIDFTLWSEMFTGLYAHSSEWEWCFSGDWRVKDNTPIGAAKRIEYLLNHGLPSGWHDQMLGGAPLCY